MLNCSGTAWRALSAHQRQMACHPVAQLFAEDAQRFQRFSWTLAGLLVDASKHRMVAETLTLLRALAAEAGLERQRDALFAGEVVNHSEGRPAMHMALRHFGSRPMLAGGEDVMPEVRRVRAQMQQLEQSLRDGTRCGASGERFTDVVHVGIGGSDLGPRLVCEALAAHRLPGLRLHFVANVDGSELHALLPTLRPSSTLFVVASKSFTTQESLTNALQARQWGLEAGGWVDWRPHFLAVSANLEEVQRFGLSPETHCLRLWDWVGGRYSLWSAVGLPIVLSVGYPQFEQLLRGAAEVDEHVRASPLADNVPYTLALLQAWYRNFWHAATHLVVPYDQRLASLPAFLQQLEMESNGKRVSQSGERLPYDTAPVVWGAVGTNAQHSFFQMWHQGTQTIPGDLIAAVQGDDPWEAQHRLLLAHCLAQAQGLMVGNANQAARQQSPGNQPTTTILLPRLTPAALGALLAMYEHKTFAAAALWGINAFDQWGVQLGKRLAAGIERDLAGEGTSEPHDGSTLGLLAHCRARNR